MQAFSDDSKDAELLLRDVTVYKNKSAELLYQIGALYISRPREKILIECEDVAIAEKTKWKEEEIEQRKDTNAATTSDKDDN